MSHDLRPLGTVDGELGASPVVTTAWMPGSDGPGHQVQFFPRRPVTIAESGLREIEIEALLLKSLMLLGAATGKALSSQIRMGGELVRGVLERLRAELLVTLKSSTETGDFVYMLSEAGAERARQYSAHSTYCGAAPVTLEDYTESVAAQSICRLPVRLDAFQAALSDLDLPPDVLSRLAQSVNAGRGLFLYGPPGNGKTSVAERLTRTYQNPLWIPRAITVGGEIIRLYDSSVHEELAADVAPIHYDPEQLDRRWVLIRRPTIVTGGELMLEHLDFMPSNATGVLEAPVQMKANGGTLVIDDFGRQRCSATDLLNRWIVTLEKRADFLTLPNGRQVRVPFDEHLVLATNLRPQDVVDEAYMRRIPFKIELRDPSEATFIRLFQSVCQQTGVEYNDQAVNYLIEKYYRSRQMPFRCCHARDLVFLVRNFCELHELPSQLSERNFEVAASNYFCATA